MLNCFAFSSSIKDMKRRLVTKYMTCLSIVGGPSRVGVLNGAVVVVPPEGTPWGVREQNMKGDRVERNET